MLEGTTTITSSNKKTIMIVIPYYYPGYKAGGVLRAVVNLVDWIGDQYDFWILTQDRDLGDSQAYTDYPTGEWIRVRGANVRYEPYSPQRISDWVRIIKSIDYDLLLIESLLFSVSSYLFVLLRFGRLPKRPVLVSTNGMLGGGALSLKSHKKTLWIGILKLLGIHQLVDWKATSPIEKAEIQDAFDSQMDNIFVAPYFPPKLSADDLPAITVKPPKAKCLRLIFLSRISPKKNLNFALEVLRHVKYPVVYDIYGPIEDQAYWEECQTLIKSLPPNIEVNYKGTLEHQEVVNTFHQYHGFLFPTLSENYGYVLAEALSAGCVLITSDQTPWRDLESKQVGWDIPLSDRERYIRMINELAEMSEEQFTNWSSQAQAYAIESNEKSAMENPTVAMLESILD